jgi:hypothetical protein
MNDEIDHGPKNDMGSAAADPLPREWMPEAAPPDGHPTWESRTARIMVAVEPEWARLRLGARQGAASWLSEMGGWLRPAVAIAAAAVALLFLVVEPPASAARILTTDDMALSLIVSDGDPVALWAALGVPADPVLALLTFEDHGAMAAPASPTTPSEEGIR